MIDVTDRYPTGVARILETYGTVIRLKRASNDSFYVFVDDVRIGSGYSLTTALRNAEVQIKRAIVTRAVANPNGDALQRLAITGSSGGAGGCSAK